MLTGSSTGGEDVETGVPGVREAQRVQLPQTVLTVARTQAGVVSRAQLLAAGLTPEALRWRVGREWRLLLPAVYALQTGPPSDHQRLVAAQLFAGEQAWFAGRTAVHLHGLRACRLDLPFTMLVPDSQRPRRVAWVDVRSTSLTGEPLVERGPLRLGCLARSVVDAAAGMPSERDARALVLEAVQRRLVRLDDLELWVDARNRRGSVRLRRLLAEAAAGAWSVPESDLLALVARSATLPPAWPNPLVTGPAGESLTSPDAWFDDVGMAVLVQSRQFHAGALDWDATVVAGSDLSAVRVVVVGVTPEAIARDPEGQLRRIERAHEAARRSGTRAPVTVTPRPVITLHTEAAAGSTAGSVGASVDQGG